jgi:hypothetical protein
MSRPSRPNARGLKRRRERKFRLVGGQILEDRQLLAPVLTTTVSVPTFTPLANQPNTQNLGNVTFTQIPVTDSSAPYTSVSLFASNSEFGGDIVRIKAGPGGDFGEDLYAISRGAGDNAALGAINRPGVIYRFDPATGKASVFFDLNTVISQLEPGGTAANSVSAASGLVNWYDIAFDPEGYFDGKPSMFVSSVDSTDPNKNIIYQIGPDGSFLGAFVAFTEGQGTIDFKNHPTAILVPPVQQQSFLRGLLSGAGSPAASTAAGAVFTALFFDANAFQPGQDIQTATLPPGVDETAITFGPQTAFAPANTNYASPDYATFTDFGTPTVNGFPGQPGLSGIQGLGGDLLIKTAAGVVNIDNFPVTGPQATVVATPPGAATPSGVDTISAIGTPYRRFEDAAFDQFGYFSYGTSFTAGNAASVGAPTYSGSMFVADLASGLAVSVTPPNSTIPVAIPVQGPGLAGVEPNGTLLFPPGTFGGRIIRIDQNGVEHPFASNFHTSNSYFSDSFIDSSLSISFSADGTTLYASDDDGIWQFKTTASLAGSSTGDLIGLNDLRTFGVPYDGQDSAVAVIDTGVDAVTPEFRGRVSTGINITTGGPGNDDTASKATGNGKGHGTPVAGVIAQFVPQATIDPINIFTPNQAAPGNATAQTLYNGLDFLTKNPFATDPVRPNKVDRVVASNMGFGTTATFTTEGEAFRKYPQIVISLKNELAKLRQLGITPVAAAGQFGSPFGSGTTSTTAGDVNGMSIPAILDEAVSVTGSSPLPYSQDASTPPTDPSPGVYPRPLGPVLVFGANNGLTGTGTDVLAPAGTVTAGDILLFEGKILDSSNRSSTTDYAAPAIDLPTFSLTAAGDGGANNVFTQGGTSLASAVVTGSFAMTASALSYWSILAQGTGVTSDAYLTTPVGVRTLNFGPHSLVDLSAYDNPDGINAILQWTAVPATDMPNTADTAVNQPHLIGSADWRQYSRVDIGNAIAAIEGTVAINYLMAHNDFSIIDENHNGLITAQELQDFENNAATIGLPEAGAMARLLGGTAAIPAAGSTVFGETPDDPAALQRRYNFFDYAADGKLNGAISIQQYQMLAKTLLPAPDQFAIVDRQANAHTGYLLSPLPNRDYANLGHIKPTFAWVPPRIVKRYRLISPDKFHVDRGVPLSTANPPFTLFQQQGSNQTSKGTGASGSHTPTATPTPTPTSTPTPTPTPTTGGSQSSTGSSTTGTTTHPSTGTTNTQPSQSTTNTGTSTTGTSQSNANSILSILEGLANRNAGNPSPAGEVGPNLSSTPSATEKATFSTPANQPAGTVHQMSTNATTVPQTTASTGAPLTAREKAAQERQDAIAHHQSIMAQERAGVLSKLLNLKRKPKG